MNDESSDTCEVCIVGAGIAGMNALVVASGYLSRADKVVLVDKRPRVGGMWVDTYDYVRLHQPHGIFTAGNIKWELDVDPSHLATKPEVLQHLQHCLETAEKRVDVEKIFGWGYESHEEFDGHVAVTLARPDGRKRVVRAKRLIKAFGHLVPVNEPIALSSKRIRSVVPEMLGGLERDMRESDVPIWIVGGGKTAMDTAHRLISTLPGREINMAVGGGTYFARRETFFPSGAQRLWSGIRINAMARETAVRFDGTNEDAIHDWFRAKYGVAPTAEASDFLGAYISEAECAVIKSGVGTLDHEYFVDAEDRNGVTELVFRSGRTRVVPSGTWVVNCTGSLFQPSSPYEPFASAGGRVVSIQMRSSISGVVSSFGGYFLTHLLFTGQMHAAGLYEMDIEGLYRKSKPIVYFAGLSLSLHNLSVMTDALPSRTFLDCGLDYDRWYPMPRRMAGIARLMSTHRRDRKHHQKTLDTLRERFDIRCGPLF